MDWKTIQFPNEFEVGVPSDATYRLDESGDPFIIRLKTNPESEVLVGRYDFKEMNGDVSEKVKEAAHRFCKSIGKTLNRELLFSIVDHFDAVKDLFHVQAVVVWEEDQTQRCWIVRVYAYSRAKDYFVIHWNGNKDDTFGDPIRILESFNPIAHQS